MGTQGPSGGAGGTQGHHGGQGMGTQIPSGDVHSGPIRGGRGALRSHQGPPDGPLVMLVGRYHLGLQPVLLGGGGHRRIRGAAASGKDVSGVVCEGQPKSPCPCHCH